MSSWSTTTLGTTGRSGHPHKAHTRRRRKTIAKVATGHHRHHCSASQRLRLRHGRPPTKPRCKRRRSPCRPMPTTSHTRQHQTAPTLTTSIAREICWTCADRDLCQDHRLLVIVATWTRTTAPPTPQPRSEARGNPSDTPETDYRSPRRDPNSARRIIVAKLHQRPRTAARPPSPPPLVPRTVADSETMPSRRKSHHNASIARCKI